MGSHAMTSQVRARALRILLTLGTLSSAVLVVEAGRRWQI